MNRHIFLWALVLSFLLTGLWTWRSHVAARRRADMALFEAYVDGPLTDYTLAVTRTLPIIFGVKGGDLPLAVAASKRSVGELKDLLQNAPPGWIRERLEFVVPLQQEMATLLASPLPKDKQKREDWIEEEKDVRGKIMYMLEDVRYQSAGKWKISQDRILELNALIYSLHNADDPALMEGG